MATMRRKDLDALPGEWSRKDLQRLRSYIREAWRLSTPRRLVLKRVTDKEGFATCDQCGAKVKHARVTVDHKRAAGNLFDPGFLDRMTCSEKGLQALCKKHHQQKTNRERKEKGKW